MAPLQDVTNVTTGTVQHLLAPQVIKEQGHIDVLVNNAGLGGPYAPLVDADLQTAKMVRHTRIIENFWTGAGCSSASCRSRNM